MEFKFDPTEFLKGVFTEKSAKLAIAALLVDLLLAAAVVGILVGSGWRERWLGPTETWIMAVGSILGFGVIWFILYIQTRQDLTDIYSIVRKQISGTWQVKYATSTSYGEVEERIVNCDIQEDAVRKLEMRFTIVQNPIFKSQEPNVVKDVALRMTDTGYKLFYYFETERFLTDDVVKLLRPGDSHRGEVQVETLGMLEFERPVKNDDQVQLMSGKWYDLNGNMMRILKLMQMAHEAKIKDAPFQPMAFNEIPVSQIHFDADMGGVAFQFQGEK
jgi:hypothetical protein